ncbi:hypothetical protein CAG70_19155 [Photobacterium halotolerans]|uniref:phage repressor protein CI n=1 Tax=Photobacterium halotolerans TaxID=265726 RepID=UPI0013735671|nr:phage repressor protein CI [Photobacterium halotolerans]NAX49111.1 hypothetical protein [Photobacterium halotolerans]
MVDPQMSSHQEKIEPLSYEGGKNVTSRLVEALHLSEYKELTEVLGVGKGTISTWHQREQTPFEIAVRVHLTTGVSLRWLLLGEGEMYEQAAAPKEKLQVMQVPLFSLKDGEFTPQKAMTLDSRFINTLPEFDRLIVVQQANQLVYIDANKTKPVSGVYLIRIDGDVSINSLQKLLGNKVAIEFSNSTVQLDERDIEVLGKVV